MLEGFVSFSHGPMESLGIEPGLAEAVLLANVFCMFGFFAMSTVAFHSVRGGESCLSVAISSSKNELGMFSMKSCLRDVPFVLQAILGFEFETALHQSG